MTAATVGKIKAVSAALAILSILGGAGGAYVHAAVSDAVEGLRQETHDREADQNQKIDEKLSKLNEDVSYIRGLMDRHWNNK